MLVFIRCTATDPSAKNRHNNNNNTQKGRRKLKKSKTNKVLNYGFIFRHMVRRLERKILNTCIRRKYLLDTHTPISHPPLLPLPLVTKDDDDSVSPHLHPSHKHQDFSFCSLCNFHVTKHSKHCRTCNRCVEGFDHHCRVTKTPSQTPSITLFNLFFFFFFFNSHLYLLLHCSGSTIVWGKRITLLLSFLWY